jgi:hypothetical protein
VSALFKNNGVGDVGERYLETNSHDLIKVVLMKLFSYFSGNKLATMLN